MARHGDGDPNQFLTLQDNIGNFLALVDTRPWTVALWFYADDLAADYGLWRVHDPDSTTHHYGMGILTTGAARVVAAAGGAIASGTTTNTISAGGWHHMAIVVASSTDRRVYLDGNTASKGSSATARTPSNLAQTDIGVAYMTAASEGVVGRYAEFGAWNIELTEAEIVILAKRADPRFVRMDSMVSYTPLLHNTSENEPDWLSSNLWLPTDVGVTAEDHVNVIHRSGLSKFAGVATAAAAEETRRRRRGDRVFGDALRAQVGRASLRSAAYDTGRTIKRPAWRI